VFGFVDSVVTWNCDGGPKDENLLGSPIHLNNQTMSTFGNHRPHSHLHQNHDRNGTSHKNGFSPTGGSVTTGPPTGLYQNGPTTSVTTVKTNTNTNSLNSASPAPLTTFTSSNPTPTTAAPGTNHGEHCWTLLRGDILAGIVCVSFLQATCVAALLILRLSHFLNVFVWWSWDSFL